MTDLPPVPENDASTMEVGPTDSETREGRHARNFAEARKLDELLRQRSAGWILGTSCGFEAVVLGLSAWLFCRRDY
jgi:hypothetical protein